MDILTSMKLKLLRYSMKLSCKILFLSTQYFLFYKILRFKPSNDDKFLTSIDPVELAKKFGDKLASPFYRKMALNSAEKIVETERLSTFNALELIGKRIRNCINCTNKFYLNITQST